VSIKIIENLNIWISIWTNFNDVKIFI